MTAPDVLRGAPLGDLLALGAHLEADLLPDVLLRDVLDAIRRTLCYPHVYIRLRNQDTDALEAVAFAGVAPETEADLRQRPIEPDAYQPLLRDDRRLSDSFLVPAEIAWGVQTLLVPLRSRSERLIGAIFIEPDADDPPFERENVRVVEALARQAALALENARLAERMQRLLAKEQLIAELSRTISETLELEQMLMRTVQALNVTFQASTVALLDEQGDLAIVASVGRVDEAARQVRLRRGEGICGWVVRHGMPFLSNDIWHETRVLPAARDVGTNQLIRSYIAVPLRTGGRVIGVISVESDRVDAFTYADVDLLEAVAAQIGGPIASARLFAQTQQLAAQVRRRNDYLEVINTLARMAASTLDIDRLLSSVIAEIQHGFGYGHVELYLVSEERGDFQLAAQSGSDEPAMLGYRQPISTGLLSRAYRTATTVRVDDVRRDPDYFIYAQTGTQSELCVPVVASNRVLGVLNLESSQIAAFNDEDVAALETAADVLAGAIENARLYQRAQEAAVLEERSRLARDLHDSVSQQLFSMTLTAQAARAQLGKNPARAAQQLERLQETAAAALAEMRALIFQLRPPEVSEQGLIATMQQHVTSLRRREGLTVTLEVSGDERSARGIEIAIYRIAQEALNNVVKHAGTCCALIALDLRPDAIELRVRDDGRGFDRQVAPNGGRHLGMTSMRERAQEIGGVLTVHTAPGAGTEVRLLVPRDAQDVP